MSIRKLLVVAVSTVLVLGACWDEKDGSNGGGGSGGVGGTGGTGGTGGGMTVCGSALDDFTPCGGDVEGTWMLRQVCVDFDPLEDMECPEAEGELRSVVGEGASFTFANGRSESPAARITMESVARFPLHCAEEVAERCEDLSIPMFGYLCSGTDLCTCVMRMEDEGEAVTATYTVDGMKLTLVEDGSDEVIEYEFCVRSNQLRLMTVGEDEGRVLMVADRK